MSNTREFFLLSLFMLFILKLVLKYDSLQYLQTFLIYRCYNILTFNVKYVFHYVQALHIFSNSISNFDKNKLQVNFQWFFAFAYIIFQAFFLKRLSKVYTLQKSEIDKKILMKTTTIKISRHRR